MGETRPALVGGRWGKAWPVPAPSFDEEGGPIVVSVDRGRLVDDICGLVVRRGRRIYAAVLPLRFCPKIIFLWLRSSDTDQTPCTAEADADGRLAVSRGAREDQSTALCH